MTHVTTQKMSAVDHWKKRKASTYAWMWKLFYEKKTDLKKIDAFELWCLKMLLKIPWTVTVTNREVLERIKPEISLEGENNKLWLIYFGHMMWTASLENTKMLSTFSRTKNRGHQNTLTIDTIKCDTGQGIEQLKRKLKLESMASNIPQNHLRLDMSESSSS